MTQNSNGSNGSPASRNGAANGNGNGAEELFALEMRAESLSLLSSDDLVRDGEEERLEAGHGGAYETVEGADTLEVGGNLVEEIKGAYGLSAHRQRTTIKGSLNMKHDAHGTVMGGFMLEKHLGGSLLLAGMSDDLVGGGGVRITSAIDIWLTAGLMGMEEKFGTACADGLLLEAYGKMFEREYGASQHVAGLAVMTGGVRTTTASGFWALNRFASGPRNMAPGGGGGGGGPPRPRRR